MRRKRERDERERETERDTHTHTDYTNSHRSSQTPHRTLQILRQRDWNKACVAAWHSRVADMPAESFREAFTEVRIRGGGGDEEDRRSRTRLYRRPLTALSPPQSFLF